MNKNYKLKIKNLFMAARLSVSSSRVPVLSGVLKRHKKFLIYLFLIVVLVSTSFVLLTRSGGNKTDAAWFDYSWQNRQRLTFTNSGSQINEDRKVKFEINTATLVSSGKLQSNCADIRFTDVTGKLLDYFIDTAQGDCNTASTHFYVKLSKIISGDQSIYVYYGNPGAASVQKNDFFADTTLGEGLVGYWPMEDNVSGNGQTIYDYAGVNNGTTSDANATSMDCTVSGKVGIACDFDGVDDYILATGMNANNNAEMTMTGWFKANNFSSFSAPFGYGEVNDWVHLMLGTDAKAVIWDDIDNSNQSCTSPDTLNTGEWYFATISINSDGSKDLYLNGVLKCTSSSNSLVASDIASDSLTIGRRNYSVSPYQFTGSLDDLRIYSRALTATEVSQIYNAGSGSTINVPLTFTPNSTSTASEETGPGPVLYLSFDEGQGTTAYDKSGKGNNGTITGATWQSEDKCISGKCLYFDGADDLVDTNYDFSMEYSGGGSFSLWFKPITLDTGGKIKSLISKVNYEYMIAQKDAGIEIIHWESSSGLDALHHTISNVLQENKWHQLTFIYNGDLEESYVYLDGNLINTEANIRTTLRDRAESTRIGYGYGWGASTTPYFNGFIDEVKIYPFALTAAQVKADYTAKGGGAKGVTAYVNDDKYKSLNDGLVGYWPMEETAENTCSGGEDLCDKSGNDNHGVLGSTAVLDSAKFGNGSSFTVDANSYVDLGADTIYNPGTGSMTYSFWAKLPTQSPLNHWYEYIAKQGDWNTGSTIEVTSRYALIRHNGVSYSRQYSYIDDNTWHHVVAIFDRDVTNKISVYIDGQKDQTFPDGDISALSGIDLQPTYNLYVNKGFHGTAPVEGLFDEVRIYNRALSSGEVQALYEWAPGPVAHYAMDDGVTGDSQTIIDSSGNGNNGTTSSANGTGMDCTVQGQYGGACEFDGVDDTISITNLPITDKSRTITAWVKPNGATEHVDMVFGGGRNWYAGLSSNSKMIESHDNTTPSQVASYSPNNTFNTDVWGHLAWITNTSGDNVDVSFYLNGVLVSTSSYTNGHANVSATSWHIGSLTGNTAFLKGALDDVRIYNYALTPKQIRNIMNARPVDATAVGSPLGSPIAHYTFDEGYGTTAYDSVGGYNGTFGGATNPAWVGGKFGKALDFTATTGNDGSRVSYTGDDLDIGTTTGDELTISMWLKPDTSQTNPSAYFIRNGWGADENYGFLIRELSGGLYKIRMEYYDGAFRSITSTNRIVPAGEWSYLVIKIIQGTSVSYYVNGEFKETVSWTGNSSVSSNSTFNIGGHAGTTNQSYDGLIDEVKIYNYALTPDEIAQDYNQSSRLVLGSNSTESDGASSSNSSDRTYCVPGDTATCDPPVFEMTFDQQKVSGAGQTIYDTSGNGNNGTTSSANGTGMNCSVAGKVGNACEFDGVDDYIDLGTSSTLEPTSALSVSAWVYRDADIMASYGIVSSQKEANNGGYILTGVATNKVGFYIRNSGWKFAQSDAELPINQWSHLYGTWDGFTVKLYVNGVLQSSTASSTSIEYPVSPYQNHYIGRYVNGYWPGKIDQVRIYDYARTPAQIAWEYNQGAPVAWYKFDECQGTTIYDWSENASGQSNGNHGTLNIGATGTQTSAGTCSSGTSTQAWNNGTTGKWGSAISFDGTDDYFCVDTNNDSSCDDVSHLDITGAMSVSAWVKTTASAGAIVSKDGVTDPSWELRIDSNTEGGRPGFMVDSGDVDITGPFKVNEGVWHHLIVTFEPSVAAKMYVDGIYVAQESPTNSSLINNSQSLYIGARPYAHALGLNGLIDDVRIYNYALTPEQVKSVYNDGAVNFR